MGETDPMVPNIGERAIEDILCITTGNFGRKMVMTRRWEYILPS
jgi:hypothetical protein